MEKITPDNETIKGFIDQARKNLEDDGDITPTFFVSKDDRLAIIGAPFSNDEEKEQAVMAVRKACSQMDADWVFYISEAWMVKRDTEEEMRSGLMPSQDPERIEVVMFNLQTKGGVNYWATAEQILHTDGSKTFSEVKMEKMGDSMKGLFMDLLTAPKTNMEAMAERLGIEPPDLKKFADE